MSVNSYLSDLSSSLVLSETEKSSITTSINTINTRIPSYFGLQITDKLVFGSYTRGTILPRKADEKSDIDYMVVFDNSNNYTPQTYLNKLKTFAEYYYSTSEIHQSSPTMVLELNHIKFELVPAYNYYGALYIPNGIGGWMITDPNGFNAALTTCNTNNASKIKPIIRLIKYWNIQKNFRGCASFDIEKKISENLKYEYFTSPTYTEYLKKALSTIRDYSNASKIDTAISHIEQAISYENQGMPYTALDEIKKAFPEV